MLKFLTVLLCCWGLCPCKIMAADYTEQEGRAAWARLKAEPITESNFRAVCDLLQDIAKTNINLSYEILAEYVPMVRKTARRDHLHILLMGWAKAKESLMYFADAELLYAQARENAAEDARRYNEALVGTLLMYADEGKLDSVDKYSRLGRESAERSGDRENLSFIYTFGSIVHLADTAALGQSLKKAMQLASGLLDKNALFTARYNYASLYCRNSPQRQVIELDALLQLSKDSSLNHKPRLYERTAFTFRNPVSNIYLQLMQVNIMLTDYDNAWKFAELLYDAVIKPNPQAPQAAYFFTELAMVKAYQQEYAAARVFLERSRTIFKVTEDKIPYPSYFLAAAMLAEHDGNDGKAMESYERAYRMGPMEGLHLMPSELYYAHALVRARRLAEAEKVMAGLEAALPARMYSTYGFYFYKYFSELQKAKGDYPGYAKALETYYMIRDSLTNFRQYRAVREIEERMRVRDKEQQISILNAESVERARNQRRERVYFIVSLALAVTAAVLLIAFSRVRIRQMARQHRIDVLQGRIDAEQRERKKVADQLHDEVGGLLSLAILNVSSVLEHDRVGAVERGSLGKAQDILGSVAVTVRELSHRLTPLDLEKLGFRKAVEEIADAINLSRKLKVNLVVTGFDNTDTDFRKFGAEFLNDVYRMVQELLNNVVKHAEATQVSVELTEHPDIVSLLVEDDGRGFDESVMGKGLMTIRRKVQQYRGRMEIGSKAMGGGTLIVIELNKR